VKLALDLDDGPFDLVGEFDGGHSGFSPRTRRTRLQKPQARFGLTGGGRLIVVGGR